jgi:hypothetical protein
MHFQERHDEHSQFGPEPAPNRRRPLALPQLLTSPAMAASGTPWSTATASTAARRASDCKSGNHDCKGQNDCKGQGFKALSVTGLQAAGGSLTEPK